MYSGRTESFLHAAVKSTDNAYAYSEVCTRDVKRAFGVAARITEIARQRNGPVHVGSYFFHSRITSNSGDKKDAIFPDYEIRKVRKDRGEMPLRKSRGNFSFYDILVKGNIEVKNKYFFGADSPDFFFLLLLTFFHLFKTKRNFMAKQKF